MTEQQDRERRSGLDWSAAAQEDRAGFGAEKGVEKIVTVSREALAKALNPDAFNVNHPGYSELSYRIAREEAFSKADRVLVVVEAEIEEWRKDAEAWRAFNKPTKVDQYAAERKAFRSKDWS